MTFEELNKLMVAVRAHKISYDFFARTVEMIITPEYGVKEEVKEKAFKLVFENCINLSVRGLSKYGDLGLEFTAWGKLEDKNITTELIDIRNELRGFGKFSASIGDDLGDYDTYFFENIFRDILYITCWTVTVSEVSAF